MQRAEHNCEVSIRGAEQALKSMFLMLGFPFLGGQDDLKNSDKGI